MFNFAAEIMSELVCESCLVLFLFDIIVPDGNWICSIFKMLPIAAVIPTLKNILIWYKNRHTIRLN